MQQAMVNMNGGGEDTLKSGDGYGSGASAAATPRATPRSGDAYNSFAGTPRSGLTPRETPRATPSRRSSTSLVDNIEAGRKSASSLLFSHLHVGRKSARLSDEDELHHSHNGYYEEAIRISNASTPRGGANLSMPGPILAPEFDPALAADVEAARHYAMMDRGGSDTTTIDHVAVTCYKPPPPVSLQFHDVHYEVTIKKTDSVKRLLHGITGSVAPGEMLAMMGPSGSGKTTFLNVLGGRTPSYNTTSGRITYNGLPFGKQLKSRMGFVTQDDILYPHLTVKETLMYAALLRLPRHYSRRQKVERAETVLDQLLLRKCADTVIGGAFLRGVSGGERKRVCIGHEILIDPSLLFLDEPTSGLDSTTALRLIHLLKTLAQGGRTIVSTIHQPSSRMFHMFDKLILLSDGHSLYFGPGMEAVSFFERLGFKAQVTMNPAELLLDLCSGTTDDISLPDRLMPATVIDCDKTEIEQSTNNNKKEPRPSVKDVKQYLVEVCENQKGRKEMEMEVNPSHVTTTTGDINAPDSGDGNLGSYSWNTSWCQQFMILLSRGLKERRHEYLSSLRITQVLASAIVSGFLWWQSKIRNADDLQDQTGLLFFLAMYWGYLPLVTAIFTFPLERAVLMKERASNMYRLSAYFVARNIGDLPLDLMMPLAFVLIVYFMAHLRYSVQAFFFTLLTIFLIVITSQGLGLLIGAALLDVKKATTLASVLFVTFVLAGGFVLQHLPGFIRWVQYLSFQNYAFKLLIKVQYPVNERFDCGAPTNRCGRIATSPSLHGVKLGGGGEEVCILLAMSIGFRLLAYMALRRMKTSL